MRWRLNSCRARRENVSLLASDALPEAEQARVREHLAQCARCRQVYQEITALTGEFQQWANAEPAVEADAAFHAQWTRSIQAANAPAPTSWPTLVGRWTESLWPSPAAWVGLAAVWVCLLSIQWAMSAQRSSSHELSRASSSGAATAVTFAERQRELAALLESLMPPSAPKPEPARPRSQRQVESVTT